MRKLTDEHRKKISENHADMSGENNPMFGKHLTEEQKLKVSMTHKGKKLTKEHRLKMSLSQKKRWTEELKEKVSIRYSGENNPNWAGGVNKLHKSERRIETCKRKYINWRTAVFEMDNYICVNCGKRGGKLNADHIKPWSLFPKLRYEISNGRTLCNLCHIKTESYGNQKNYIDQIKGEL